MGLIMCPESRNLVLEARSSKSMLGNGVCNRKVIAIGSKRVPRIEKSGPGGQELQIDFL